MKLFKRLRASYGRQRGEQPIDYIKIRMKNALVTFKVKVRKLLE